MISYSIAWERKQLFFLVLLLPGADHAIPIGGLAVGLHLASPQSAGRTYAINLLGSALGALLAPVAPWLAGVTGALIASAALPWRCLARVMRWPFAGLVAVLVVALLVADSAERRGKPAAWRRHLALQGPFPCPAISEATLLQRWNAIARLDPVAAAGTRRFPV